MKPIEFKNKYQELTGYKLDNHIKSVEYDKPTLVCWANHINKHIYTKVTFILRYEHKSITTMRDEVALYLNKKEYIEIEPHVFAHYEDVKRCKVCNNRTLNKMCNDCIIKEYEGITQPNLKIRLSGKRKFNTEDIDVTSQHLSVVHDVYEICVYVKGKLIVTYTSKNGSTLNQAYWRTYVTICTMYDFKI